MTWRMMVMMRAPPGLPSTRKTWPSCVSRVGLIELSGRLPGAISLALPWTRPNMFGEPGLAVKSSISSLRKKPVFPAMTLAPK